MHMGIDQARNDHFARGVYFLIRLHIQMRANRRNAVALDGHVAYKGLCARAIHNQSAANDDIHSYILLRVMGSIRGAAPDTPA